ncbi:hypothetical protein Tco_1052853 [Tanacetum coccineum]
MATLNEPFSLELGSGSGPWRQETIGGMQAQTRYEGVSNLSTDPPLSGGHTLGSGEDSMEHQIELTDNVPNTPYDSPLLRVNTPVLDLEKEKDTQAVEILKLKKRVKKLERQRKSSISHPRRRIYRQVESSDDDLDEEDASKQGRKREIVYAATFGVSTAGALVSNAGLSTSAAGTSTGILEYEMNKNKERLTTPPPSQPSDTRDKGKGIMVEPDPPVKIKRSDQGDLQLQADAELAQLLHQEELAQEEREQFTIKERAQFLVETIVAQKKFRAAQRTVDIISKPPTKTQLRNMMITYLKNMGKFNHNQLKGKSYEELQRLYEREQKWINDFVPVESEKEEKKSIEPKKQESAKSDEDAVADYELEKEELRMWLTIVPDEEETVDLDILSAKYPIANWESPNLGNVDMEDLHVYKIIRAEDEIWSNQQDLTLISWKLYENCGVHTLLMDGTLTCFNMLVEKRYPLIKEMLEKMLNWKLEAKAESTIAFELLKFIKSQLED